MKISIKGSESSKVAEPVKETLVFGMGIYGGPVANPKITCNGLDLVLMYSTGRCLDYWRTNLGKLGLTQE